MAKKKIAKRVEKTKKKETIKLEPEVLPELEVLPEYKAPVVYEPEEPETFVAPVFVQCPNCLKMVDTNTIFACPQCNKAGCPKCGWDETKFSNCPNCGIAI